VCPADLTELLRTHAEEWNEVDDDGLGVLDVVCGSCRSTGEAVDHPDNVFVYVWRRGESQREFYGLLCHPCGERLIRDFALVQEEDRPLAPLPR
jgi:hypothetical protein